MDLAPGPQDGGSLVQVYDLLIETDGFESFLAELATLARDVIHGDLSIGITVLRDGHYVTAASSDRRADVLDEEQYSAGHGPCLQSLETCEELYVPDFALEGRWPDYARLAKTHGLKASLSVPITLDDRAAGALNVYRFDAPEIAEAERAAARRVAAEAGRAMLLAVRQARQLQLTEDLRTAMGTRRVIDQAIGVIMAQNRCTPDEAFGVLRRASQHRNTKLRQVAADVVTSVSGQQPSGDAGFRS